MHVLLLVLL